MRTLKELLDAIHGSVELSSAHDIKYACELILRVEAMTGGERDTIVATYKHGPLFDGDVPSKAGRDSLVNDGFVARVIVEGKDGFNACTYKGMWAFKLIEAGA